MKIVILGNGISGITAARHLRKQSDHEIIVISSENKYFYSRTALMYIYMGHMTLENTQPFEPTFWEKNRIDLIQDHVKKVNLKEKSLSFTSERADMSYDRLIIAVGSAPNKFGWPGQNLDGVSGLYSLQDLATMERYSEKLKRAVIVGGGLIGIEMAEMFHSRNIPVSFLVREKSYWENTLPPEESAMVNHEIRDHHIDLRLETELAEIIDDGNGAVAGVKTNRGEDISCGFVGLTAGVHPNINFLRGGGLELDKGILVDSHLRTSDEHVFAIGDCAQLRQPLPERKPIEAIWYTGRMMGELVAFNLLHPEKALDYNPGLWFNSAKFFNIEYQVYGQVPASLPKEMSTIFWQSKNRKKSLRINYHSESKEVHGFHLMGIRFRQQVCEQWLHKKSTINEVMENLELAAFDPELYQHYEEDIRALYYKQTGKKVKPKSSRKLNHILQFLKK